MRIPPVLQAAQPAQLARRVPRVDALVAVRIVDVDLDVGVAAARGIGPARGDGKGVDRGLVARVGEGELEEAVVGWVLC